jgi:hypothetical protein
MELRGESRETHNAKVEIGMKSILDPGMKSILDPTFRYTKSIDTDIRKTFARIRREQQKLAQAQSADASGVVLPLGQRKVRAAA